MTKEQMVEGLIDKFYDMGYELHQARVIAMEVVGFGYIPKSMALEMVEVCPRCCGNGFDHNLGRLHLKCPKCKARGIVLKGASRE